MSASRPETSELARQHAWHAYSAAVEQFLAARPGSPEFGSLLSRMNTLEMELERADALAEGHLAEAEATLALEVVIEHLRPRVRESTLRLVLVAIEEALRQQAESDARAADRSGEMVEPRGIWGGRAA